VNDAQGNEAAAPYQARRLIGAIAGAKGAAPAGGQDLQQACAGVPGAGGELWHGWVSLGDRVGDYIYIINKIPFHQPYSLLVFHSKLNQLI
jgi:hypothetical protein